MKKKIKNIFLDSLVGVKPIKKSNKLTKPIPIKKSNKITFDSLHLKKKSNVLENLIEKKLFEKPKIETSAVNKKLKKGKIPIDKRIDFHGLSLFDAESLFTHTINICYKRNLRCILFVTGKGVLKKTTNDWNESKLYYGKIRSNFLIWTKKKELSKFILNVEQASIKYGADGAFFVYLRRQKY